MPTPREVGPPPLDLSLTEGFRFECRPDCGLCCYASPALSPAEVAPLLAIAPTFRPSGDPPGFIPSRPDGGACLFLHAQRCTVHEARPGPCAEFPLSAHLAERIQVSVVLSCPGLSIGSLLGQTGTPRRIVEGVAPSLAGELAAVVRATSRLTESDRQLAERRWHRALGVPRSPGSKARAVADAIVRELRTSLPRPTADDLAAVPIPDESEGLERLPMFFDARYGRVALCAGDEGVDLLVLREGGGVEERLASFAYPERLPRMTPEADRMLLAYLDYVAQRDAFLGAALYRHDPGGETSLIEQCTEDLREIAAAAVSRSVYRAWLHGGSSETLGDAEIADGIRATDADYLDRPTVGRWL